MWFLYNTEILRALRFKSSFSFLNAPSALMYIYVTRLMSEYYSNVLNQKQEI